MLPRLTPSPTPLQAPRFGLTTSVMPKRKSALGVGKMRQLWFLPASGQRNVPPNQPRHMKQRCMFLHSDVEERAFLNFHS